jgi:hypothetical protein
MEVIFTPSVQFFLRIDSPFKLNPLQTPQHPGVG